MTISSKASLFALVVAVGIAAAANDASARGGMGGFHGGMGGGFHGGMHSGYRGGMGGGFRSRGYGSRISYRSASFAHRGYVHRSSGTRIGHSFLLLNDGNGAFSTGF